MPAGAEARRWSGVAKDLVCNIIYYDVVQWRGGDHRASVVAVSTCCCITMHDAKLCNKDRQTFTRVTPVSPTLIAFV